MIRKIRQTNLLFFFFIFNMRLESIAWSKMPGAIPGIVIMLNLETVYTATKAVLVDGDNNDDHRSVVKNYSFFILNRLLLSSGARVSV